VFDPLIHQPIRTQIISIISSNEEGASFSQLLEATNATNGNLSSHLKTLEDSGYIVVNKFFEGRRPKSIYSLTPLGLEAFLKYIDELSKFVAVRSNK
jgi:DNA-binding HxlR family transcriptional regulator